MGTAMTALVGAVVLRPGAFVFGVLVPLLIIGLVVYAAWELVRSREHTAPAGAPGTVPSGAASSALALLDERFARGEIDATEYVQRRNLLVHGGPPAAPAAPAPAPADTTPASVPAAASPAGPDAPEGAGTVFDPEHAVDDTAPQPGVTGRGDDSAPDGPVQP